MARRPVECLRVMRTLSLLLATAALSVGCDDRSKPTIKPTSRPDSPPATAPAAATVNSPTKSIPLMIIPFNADVPEGWAVQSGLAGRIVLHGTLGSGDIDVLLSTRQPLNADAFNNLVKEKTAAATQPGKQTTRVMTRDNLTIIESSEILSSPGLSPDVAIVTYNVKYLVQGPSLDYLVYEVNVADLSQTMFEKDGELIRKVLLGLKYDTKATEQTP